MGAQILKIPEIQLSEAEAKKLDAAIIDVMRFYTDVEISPVVQAWLNLAMVAGVLYGPRIMAYNIRAKNRPTIQAPSAATPTRPPATVTPIKPSPQATAKVPADKQGPQPGVSADLLAWSQWNAQSAAINIQE